MLRELCIENLAVIEKAVIAFGGAFNAFTGETGAGKSILIGSINAVLGGRVYKDMVRAGAEKAVVTALFDGLPVKTVKKLTEYGYGGDFELTLAREISADGKSAARINGRTATASVLKEVAEGLIDIHGQNETHSIAVADRQLELIDSFGNISLSEYERSFREFSAVSRKIKTLQNENESKAERIERLTGRLDDLSPYKLKKGEEEELAGELWRARNARALSETIGGAYSSVSGDGDEAGALGLLGLCKGYLGEAAKHIPGCKALKERLEGVIIELDDIKREIGSYLTENEDDNPQRLSYLEERVSDFLRLERKYGTDIDGLVEKIEGWRAELDGLLGAEDITAKLRAEKKRLGDEVRAKAEALTAKRLKTAERLASLIREELIYLDMPDVRLVFDITREKVTVKGMDGARLMISVNKGEEPKPASKIASGGELSRIMLAIKSVLAESDDIPVMVFDEIDSGISGRAAHKVGVKLKNLSKKRQVLCVTHLAQIAALADNHLLIEKKSDGKRVFTNVKSVSGEERKRELARIISGDEDELSLANAERLIERRES
ncbi:MAG: DNA repair protein RecN [Oscillospiraceae bacterium]|jgi:DNA repair protein RecN (Recombination protein N)|nr:DNA repair protein RecN [Oscillospiraceae bacterium]